MDDQLKLQYFVSHKDLYMSNILDCSTNKRERQKIGRWPARLPSKENGKDKGSLVADVHQCMVADEEKRRCCGGYPIISLSVLSVGTSKILNMTNNVCLQIKLLFCRPDKTLRTTQYHNFDW